MPGGRPHDRIGLSTAGRRTAQHTAGQDSLGSADLALVQRQAAGYAAAIAGAAGRGFSTGPFLGRECRTVKHLSGWSAGATARPAARTPTRCAVISGVAVSRLDIARLIGRRTVYPHPERRQVRKEPEADALLVLQLRQ